MQSIDSKIDIVKFEWRLTWIFVAEGALHHATWDILPYVLLINTFNNFTVVEFAVRDLVGFLDPSFFLWWS